MLARNLQLFAFAVVLGGLMMFSSLSLGQELGKAANFAARSTEKRSALEQQILKLNQEMLDAEVRADVPALEQFFTDGFVRMTQGGILNRSDYLGGVKAGRNRFLAYDLSDVQIHLYGTAAILAGGFHLKSAAGDTQNLFASVWIQQKGKWQTAAWVTNRSLAGKAVPGDAPVKNTDTTGLSALEQSLLKRNDEVFGAQVRAETAALGQFLTSDFFRLTVDGIRNRTGFLDDLKTGKIRFEILEPNDVKIHVYGTTAVLAGGFRLKNAASDTQNLFLDVWVQQKGKWRLAAWIADPHPQPQTTPAARP